ncbi:MAG: 30S ribosomal protein S27e [Candidatus Diapherotrites archaeon]
MSNDNLIPNPKTKFIRVKCSGCGNEQTIFNSAASDVKCNACNQLLAKSKSSRIELKAKVVKEME